MTYLMINVQICYGDGRQKKGGKVQIFRVDVEAGSKTLFQQAVSTFPHVRIELKLDGHSHKEIYADREGARPKFQPLPEEAGLDLLIASSERGDTKLYMQDQC
eukprot:scaffold19553_cov139-Skeletonema_marinoi.AAC.2